MMVLVGQRNSWSARLHFSEAGSKLNMGSCCKWEGARLMPHMISAMPQKILKPLHNSKIQPSSLKGHIRLSEETRLTMVPGTDARKARHARHAEKLLAARGSELGSLVCAWS